MVKIIRIYQHKLSIQKVQTIFIFEIDISERLKLITLVELSCNILIDRKIGSNFCYFLNTIKTITYYNNNNFKKNIYVHISFSCILYIVFNTSFSIYMYSLYLSIISDKKRYFTLKRKIVNNKIYKLYCEYLNICTINEMLFSLQ